MPAPVPIPSFPLKYTPHIRCYSRTMKRLICAVAALFVVVAPALPQGSGNGRGRGHQEAQSGKGSPLDGGVITSYYRETPGGLPPGLAKRGGLPPGLEKQLRRNGTLPPGLAK